METGPARDERRQDVGDRGDQAILDGDIPEQVVLHAEKAIEKNPVCRVPPCSQLQFQLLCFCFSFSLDFHSWTVN
ncbi:hypothetical protein STEG23_006820, partial [Scotinomys teguina]